MLENRVQEAVLSVSGIQVVQFARRYHGLKLGDFARVGIGNMGSQRNAFEGVNSRCNLRSTVVFVHPQCPEHLWEGFYEGATTSDYGLVKVIETVVEGKAVYLMCEFIDDGSQELWVKDMTGF